VVKYADAAADHGFVVLERGPTKADARPDINRVHARVGLVQAGFDIGAVGNTAGIGGREAGQRTDGPYGVGKAVGLADRVGVVFKSHTHGDLEARLDGPVVMRIRADTPQSDRHVAGQIQRLTVLIANPVDKVLETVVGV